VTIPALVPVAALVLVAVMPQTAHAADGFVAHLRGEGRSEPAQVVCVPIQRGIDCAIARDHPYIIDCGTFRGDGIHFVVTTQASRVKYGCARKTGKRKTIAVGAQRRFGRAKCAHRRRGSGIGATTVLICRVRRRAFSVDVDWVYRRLNSSLVVRPCGDGRPGIYSVIARNLTCTAAFALTDDYRNDERCRTLRHYQDGAALECREGGGRTRFYAGG
jgi:hypothetical protein